MSDVIALKTDVRAPKTNVPGRREAMPGEPRNVRIGNVLVNEGDYFLSIVTLYVTI